jgi:hypothetical protein
VAGALVDCRILAPPITRVTLDEVPLALRSIPKHHADGKTVVVL